MRQNVVYQEDIDGHQEHTEVSEVQETAGPVHFLVGMTVRAKYGIL